MELAGPVHLGSLTALAAEAPLRKTPDVQKIDQGRRTDDASADSRQRPEQDQTAAQARDIAARRREMDRSELPAGPSPAFEVSLLEVENDLKQVIARIEAARTQSRDGAAVKLREQAGEASDAEAETIATPAATPGTPEPNAPESSAPAEVEAQLPASGASPEPETTSQV